MKGKVEENSEKTTKTFFQRNHVFLKLHYFFYFASFGSLIPILNIFLRGQGITEAELSYMNIVVPFLLFFTNPLAGFISDHTKRYFLTFNVFLIVSTLLFASLFSIPQVEQKEIFGEKLEKLQFDAPNEFLSKCEKNENCLIILTEIEKNKTINVDRSIFASLTKTELISSNFVRFSSSFDINSTKTKFIVSCSKKELCENPRNENQTFRVLLYAVIFILSLNIYSNAISLSVALGFASLEDPDLFGAQRLYGTIGFGIWMPLTAWIRSYFKADLTYLVVFIILVFICMICTSLIQVDHKSNKEINEDQNQKKRQEKTGLAAFIPLLSKLDVIVFLSLCFLWGSSYAALDPYSYLYVNELEPERSRDIVSYLGFVSAFAEVVAFFFSSKLLNKIGIDFCSVLIFVAFAIRFAGYYLIPTAMFFMPFEIMHFFNFGIFIVLIMQDAQKLAPAGLSGTLQAVALGVSFGLGRGTGLIVASPIIQKYSIRTLFLVYSVFNLVAAILFTIFIFIRRSTEEKKSKTKNAKITAEGNQENLLTETI